MKQNCPKCNNCIHESVCHFWVYENYPSDFYENCTQYQEERPKGKWIMTSDYYTGAYETIDYVKCSCCGEESLEEGDFCPNCGARMEG